MNKLYRSRSDRVLAGVCGGLASYFQIDSTVVRLLFVFLWIATAIAPLTLAYLLAILIIPLEPAGRQQPKLKLFYRSKNNRMIAGICGALAESWNVDPTVVRLVAVLLCFITGILPMAIVYCVGWIIIPEKTGNP
jgi:phage shock protein C